MTVANKDSNTSLVSTDFVINILGYGITNRAIVALLNSHNIACNIYDDKFANCPQPNAKDSNTDSINFYYPLNLMPFSPQQDFEIQSNKQNTISIISPGISPHSVFLQRFYNLISEYDFIYFLLQYYGKTLSSVHATCSDSARYCHPPCTIWISGTNGKTTSTEMSALMLYGSAGGNIGIPLAQLFMQLNSHNNKAKEQTIKQASNQNTQTKQQDSISQDAFQTETQMQINMMGNTQNEQRLNMLACLGLLLQNVKNYEDSKDENQRMYATLSESSAKSHGFLLDYLLPDELVFCNATSNHSSHGTCSLYDWSNLSKPNQIWVLETSSFSLHYTRFALPYLYILLPLSEDHISWHGSYEDYVKDKLKVLTLMNQTHHPKSYFAVIPHALKEYTFAKDIIESCEANIFLYHDSSHLCEHFGIPKNLVQCFQEPFRLDFVVSASALKFAGIPFNIEIIKDYKIGSYRMQERIHNNLLFVNDSKATNPHAVLSALQCYQDYMIYLILGGDTKGARLETLYPFIRQHAISVFTIGKDGKNIAQECENYGICVRYCETLEQAMKDIWNQVQQNMNDAKTKSSSIFMDNDSKQKKNLILLSPACASLDQFMSYKHRGDVFDSLIDKIFVS